MYDSYLQSLNYIWRSLKLALHNLYFTYVLSLVRKKNLLELIPSEEQ